MFIIVKYADQYQGGKAAAWASIWQSYSAERVGVTKQFYNSLDDAKDDLANLHDFNPTVGYGVVECDP